MSTLYLLARKLLAGAACFGAALFLLLTPSARAGLSLEIHSYGEYVNGYAFYTPLYTNSTGQAPALGTYIIQSPQWPTSGSLSIWQLTTNGMEYVTETYSVYFDLGSMMFEMTNGNWTLLFTNATTTNLYTFTVNAPGANSNTLPVPIVTFPQNESSVATNQTNFTWKAPAGTASVNPSAQVYTQDGSYYQFSYLPAGATNWIVDTSLPLDTNFYFSVEYDVSNSLITASTPTTNSQPLAGWQSYSTFAFQGYATFSTIGGEGAPSIGHTLLAYYTFEDDNLFAEDFSGNGYNLSYAWFGFPPYITNDAEAGNYAAGLGGTGFFTMPDVTSNLFSGSFSVSLWLKTTNNVVNQDNYEPIYVSAGIVSASGNDFPNGVMPMVQSGGKLGFYTGGAEPNLFFSQASINSGQYTHLVVTRDQHTGLKCIYVNGVLDSSVYGATNQLALSNTSGPIIGYGDNGVEFIGELDQIEIYSGVLSSNDVALLYNDPGTNVANTIELDTPVARYDFEIPDDPEADSSGYHNDMNFYASGSPADVASTNAAVGMYARQFFGATSYTVEPSYYTTTFSSISNALTGSFSVTAWVNTTNSVNTDYANAFYGLPILFDYAANSNSAVPLTITGSKAACTIWDENENAVTLHSSSVVNDGNYHFLTVTRDMPSGLISLYVDGNLEATNTSSKSPLGIGFIHVAGGYYTNYEGLLDDLRIYSGVLSAADVAILAGNGGPSFNSALGISGLTWITGGDANWFIETTNTYNGAAAAAQSGSVTGSQQTVLTTTVTGPGLLDFYWSSIANDPNGGFDYEFYIDDPNTNDIADLYGDNDWDTIQDLNGGPVVVPPGQHTLGWVVYANGDTDPTEAAFLDQVQFVPTDTSPVSANVTLAFYCNSGLTPPGYYAFPSFNSITPAATGTTTNYLQSPDGAMSTSTYPGGSGSGSLLFGSLADLLGECTNGLWTLTVNQGTLLQRQFQFSVSISGLTTNALSLVTITEPTNDATGVPANTPFAWTGPGGYSSLEVSVYGSGNNSYAAALDPAATSWPSPATLPAGTNQFTASYTSNNFSGLTFSLPVDTADSQTVSNWVTSASLNTFAQASFVVAAGAVPAQLLNGSVMGTNFLFQFQSQEGFTNLIQYRTNLTTGNNWQTITNLIGDGNLDTIPIPLSVFKPSQQGFIRVLTQ